MTNKIKMECDYCYNTEDLIQLGSDLICPSCKSKGMYFPDDISKSRFKRNKAAYINVNEVLRQSRDIDSQIKVRTDLFNAATKSIIELKAAIDSDDTIENKPYTLAYQLQERMNHWKKIIFELNEQVVNAQNEQRAIQQYLNQLANTLREEERDKLKLQNITYNPKQAKVITPKTIKTAKIDKKLLREVGAKLLLQYPQLQGVEYMLQMLVVSKGCTVQFAAELLKKNIESTNSK